MNKWRVEFRPQARDELRGIPKKTAMRILAKLTDLEHDPYGRGTTALRSDPDRRRLRVGDFRVIYTLEHDRVIVWAVHIAKRDTVYS